jgi:hypothetical protein
VCGGCGHKSLFGHEAVVWLSSPAALELGGTGAPYGQLPQEGGHGVWSAQASIIAIASLAITAHGVETPDSAGVSFLAPVVVFFSILFW